MGTDNKVSMSVRGRGKSAPAEYGNTGSKTNDSGILGNTRQASYNNKAGKPSGNGKILGNTEETFYNDIDQAPTHGPSITGFGSGKNTFNDGDGDGDQNFYNELSGGSKGGRQGESGSGPGAGHAIEGFSTSSGLINAKV